MIALWKIIFYQPLYNGLVFLADILPGGDVGLAVIVLTIAVKILLFPLTQKTIISQAKLRLLEPKIQKIKELYPKKDEQAKHILALYKSERVNPFSGCLTMIFIQLPIIIALYQVFLHGLSFNADLLYSFVRVPEHISMEFLGLVHMSSKSIVLAVLAGVTQYVQAKLVAPRQRQSAVKTASFQADFAKTMELQTLYVFPVLIAFFGYYVVAAVPLYWITSNLFTIGQEILVRRKLKNLGPVLETKAIIVE